jgi:hypothetical protein
MSWQLPGALGTLLALASSPYDRAWRYCAVCMTGDLEGSNKCGEGAEAYQTLPNGPAVARAMRRLTRHGY